MWRFKPNWLQRVGLLIAAIVIAWLLWVQIDDNGLDDTNWLLPIVAIVAILLVASHGWEDFRIKLRSADVGWNEPETEADGLRAEAIRRAKVRRAMQPVVEPTLQSKELRDEFFRIVERFGLFLKTSLADPYPAFAEDFIRQTGGHVDVVALKAAFMLTLLRRELRHEGYVETNEVMELRMLVVGHVTNAIMQSLRQTVIPGQPPKRKEMLTKVAAEISHCELAVREVLAGLARNDRFPLDPILLIVNNELPLAANTANTTKGRSERYQAEVQSILDMA